jgi:hypothetical protein
MNKKQLTTESLLNVARVGITQHFCNSNNLFSYILTEELKEPEDKKLLLCHSLISLLGVSKHQSSFDFNFKNTLENLIQNVLSEKNAIRESALLLWLLSSINHEATDKVLTYVLNIEQKKILQTETMELSWLVIGLTYAYKKNSTELTKKSLTIFIDLLLKRYNYKTNLFVHKNKKHAFWDIRSNIANFADQIYSIYAISKYVKITSNMSFLNVAEKCADSIVKMQGKQGQWWWHYDVRKGSVIEKYPVYSVHQDSMAPFALMALMEVSKKNYLPALQLGLRWLEGDNELSMNMLVNSNNQFIKRGVQRTTVLDKIRKVVELSSNLKLEISLPVKYDQKKYLEPMNWEHSYHLGWVLYCYTNENKHANCLL